MCEPEVVADVFMCHRFHHNCLKQFKLLLELLYQHHSCNDPVIRMSSIVDVSECCFVLVCVNLKLLLTFLCCLELLHMHIITTK